MADHFKKEFDSFDNHLSFALRQFDVGFTDPSEPEVPQMTNNSITVGNMTGNIQQGSPGASQSFEFKLNVLSPRTHVHACCLLATCPVDIAQSRFRAFRSWYCSLEVHY